MYSYALSICSVQKFLNMFKKFWMCWKVLDVFKKILAMFKNFEHIFFFKFFPFLVILHHIQIFWTRPKNFEHVQNFLTTFKIFWSRSKILDGADGLGIRINVTCNSCLASFAKLRTSLETLQVCLLYYYWTPITRK